MPYRYCKCCNKRISQKTDYMFCDDKCETKFRSSSDKLCLYCNEVIGKEGLTDKVYCDLNCHNSHQKEKNIVTEVCIQCGEEFTKQKSFKRKTCSDQCYSDYVASDERNAKRMNSLKKTNLKKYGTEHWFSTEEGKKAVADAKEEKYGHRAFNNVEKGKATKLERYGTLDFTDKSRATQLKKYGTLNTNEKANATKLERYGTLDFTDKANRTKIERYGDLSSPLLRKSYHRLKDKYSDDVEFLFSESEFSGVVGYKKYKMKCLGCDVEFYADMTNGTLQPCPTCNPKMSGTSKLEKEVVEYISSIYDGEIIENSRQLISPLEVDIHLPDENLAIEVNGLYWHSEVAGGKDRRYHVEKLELCEVDNTQLIQIDEDHWRNKKKIVKSIIRGRLNRNEVIYARKCEIKEVSFTDASEFLDNNHIQGSDRSSVRYGLYYQEDLVSLMTFSKSRYDKKVEWEMLRFCNRVFTTVIGGASRLFTHFKRQQNPSSVISYADRSYFGGSLYETLGFTYEGTTPPNYFYLDDEYSFKMSRQSFQKHMLEEKLDTYDGKLTEWENMRINGFDRIWNCGNKKYIFKE